MRKKNTSKGKKGPESIDALTEYLREGARKLLQVAVEAELEEFLEQWKLVRDLKGRKAVVKNGYNPERSIATGIGTINIRMPKIRDRSRIGVVFHSALLPPYLRKSRSVEELVPLLYLNGVSTGHMREALESLLGADAKGFSPAMVGRLKAKWTKEYEDWRKRPIEGEWLYIWVDGIYSKMRKESDRLCLLVVMGVNARGEKKVLAIEDGFRESSESWKEVLRVLAERGLKPPLLAIGDGALGFWPALREVFPTTREQRCWQHKTLNVLNYLPKSLQARAQSQLREIWNAENRKEARKAFRSFVQNYGDKYPKAAQCLKKDEETLLAFYDFPAAHWVSIRTTNPIESTFATIRHRTGRARGCFSRESLLALVFQVAMSAEKTFRRLKGYTLIPKLLRGTIFEDGVERKPENKDKSKTEAECAA